MAPVPQSENHRSTRQEKGFVFLAQMTNRAACIEFSKARVPQKSGQLPGVEELAKARGEGSNA
ncbi:hypothetical protein HYPDE_36373 [Hyphomicrobium denitrificans 1NES1]|uniref:Uncharacterized protein n=1 Tax=Hyphomicrobium denitrificans 1NES1 TaxID=670307 RepID=N0BEM9_9HYPH|nr:hypothetical protein HYPDE_36373 [Hyphomicrobium denitrificans 1NES1]